MTWEWRVVDGCSQLVLFKGGGLSPREVGFGYVDDTTNKAFNTWTNKTVGVYESTIEAKRCLLEDVKAMIASTCENSKPKFGGWAE